MPRPETLAGYQWRLLHERLGKAVAEAASPPILREPETRTNEAQAEPLGYAL